MQISPEFVDSYCANVDKLLAKQMNCPVCIRAWPVDSEQGRCITMFNECICCRFIPRGESNQLGSCAGTADEMELISSARAPS